MQNQIVDFLYREGENDRINRRIRFFSRALPSEKGTSGRRYIVCIWWFNRVPSNDEGENFLQTQLLISNAVYCNTTGSNEWNSYIEG